MDSTIIQSGTGSGKTYYTADCVAQILTQTDNRVLMVTPNKDTMKMFASILASPERLDTDDLGEYKIQMLTSGYGDVTVGKLESGPEIDWERDGDEYIYNSRCIIASFAYLQARGFSSYYYNLLKWGDKKTHLYIDEADAYINSLKVSISNAGRVIMRGSDMKFTEKCRANARFGSNIKCESCVYDNRSQHITYNDQFASFELRRRSFKDGDTFASSAFVTHIQDILGEDTLQSGTNIAYRIPQSLTPPQPKFVEENIPEEQFESVFKHYLEAGYCPTIHQSFAMLDDNPISRDAILKLDELQRSNVVYPTNPCETEILTTIDLTPLRFLAEHCGSCTFISATWGQDNLQCLTDTFPGITHQIVTNNDHRMERITLIGTFSKIDIDQFASLEQLPEPTILAPPTKRKAESMYEKLDGTHFNVTLGISDTKYRNDRDDGKATDLLIFHGLGTLARGMDFGDFNSLITSIAMHKPRHIHATEKLEDLPRMEALQRVTDVIQILGRILRKDKSIGDKPQHKFLIVTDIEDMEEFNIIKESLAKCCDTLDATMLPKGTTREQVLETYQTRGVFKADPVMDWTTKAEELIATGKPLKEVLKRLNRNGHFSDTLDEDGQLNLAIIIEEYLPELVNNLDRTTAYAKLDRDIAKGMTGESEKRQRRRLKKRFPDPKR